MPAIQHPERVVIVGSPKRRRPEGAIECVTVEQAQALASILNRTFNKETVICREEFDYRGHRFFVPSGDLS